MIDLSGQGSLPSDSLTLLFPVSGSVTKVFRADGTTQAYQAGLLFEHASIPVSDIHGLSATLISLAKAGSCFVIRGAVTAKEERIRRKSKGSDATVEAQAHRWCMLDLDKGGPEHEGDFETAIRTWRRSLPEGLKETSVFFHLSSSQHLSPTLRGHAWFYLDREYADSELRSWAKRYGFDPSVFSPVQPHYVGNPVFEGLADPLAERCFFVSGAQDIGKIEGAGFAKLREVGERLLSEGERELRKAVAEGREKHAPLNKHGFRLGQLCPHILSESEIFERLFQATTKAVGANPGKDPSKASDELRRAISDGISQPKLKGEDWRGLLEYSGKELKINATATNVATVLLHDPRWSEVLGWNSRRDCAYFRRNPPFSLLGSRTEGPISEGDALALSLWLSAEYGFAPPRGLSNDALDTVARENPFDPVCDYLEALEWDGVPRLDTLARDLLGTEQPYESEVFRISLLAAVKRAFEPGCKSDYMVVLEGEGGLRKTSVLEWLGGEFHSEIREQTGSKDSVGAISTCWIADFSEFAAIKKGDLETVKGFITTREDTVRLSYDRRHKKVPRRCAFFATMNPSADGAYIQDSAFARRIHPIRVVKEIRLEDLTYALRDQVWAEAVSRYRQGESTWEISSQTREDLLVATKERSEDSGDPWITPTLNYLRGKGTTTLGPVLEHGLQLPPAQQTRAHQLRAARVLRELGWDKRHTCRGKVWTAPTTWLESYPMTGGTMLAGLGLSSSPV